MTIVRISEGKILRVISPLSIRATHRAYPAVNSHCHPIYRHHHQRIVINAVPVTDPPLPLLPPEASAKVPLCKTECQQFDDIIVAYLPYVVRGTWVESRDLFPSLWLAGWLAWCTPCHIHALPTPYARVLVPYEASGYVADGTTRLRGIDGGV